VIELYLALMCFLASVAVSLTLAGAVRDGDREYIIFSAIVWLHLFATCFYFFVQVLS
jgi:hypothetical protein